LLSSSSFSSSFPRHLPHILGTLVSFIFFIISPNNTATILYDLEGSGASFLTNANDWTISGLVNPSIKTYNCDGDDILGGYNIMSTGSGKYMERVYDNLPAHNQIGFHVATYLLDSWDAGSDDYQIYFDGVTVTGISIDTDSYTTLSDRCGDPSREDFPVIHSFAQVPHTANTLTLRIISLLDQDSTNESLGIRNIVFNFMTVDTPLTGFCGKCSVDLPSKWCSCLSNQYTLAPQTGYCLDCDSSCATCSDGSTSGCIMCPDGNLAVGGVCPTCTSPCESCTSNPTECTSCENPYYLSFTSCYPSCPLPLSAVTSAGLFYCNTPCPGQYAYWNQDCEATCDFPLDALGMNGYQVCNFPCSSAQFLYWDQSCSISCSSPLTLRFEHDRAFCDYGCDATEFLYWDSSCGTSCPDPLQIQVQGSVPRQFCIFPCSDSTQYLYWDGSCSSTCPSPLAKSNSKGRKFCDYPCNIASQIAYYNGACEASCQAPFQVKTYSNYQICGSPCTGTLFLYPDGSCRSSCDKSYYPTIDHGTYLCNFYCNSGLYYLSTTRSCLSACPSGYYEDIPSRACLACADTLCSQCPLNNGATCNTCKDGAVLDSTGVCKECESMQTQYIKPVGSSSHEYLVTLTPDSCDLSTALLKSSLLPTSDAKKNFPPFYFQTTKISPHTYRLRVSFNSSVLDSGNLGVTLSYLTGSLAVPKTLIASGLTQAFQDAAPTVTTALTATMGASLGGTLAIGASAALWPMISFQQFIGYFIYLNIEYPPQLEIFLTLFSFTDWDFLPNPVASLTEQWKEDLSLDLTATQGESKYQLPVKFVKYEVPTFFIDNGGSLISMNIVLLVAPFLLHHIRRIKIIKIDRFLWKLEMNLRWNGIFRAFLENSIPMFLATIIQLKKFTFDNVYTVISTLLAVLAFFYTMIMLHFVWDTLQTQSRYRLELPLVRIVYGTLYEGLDLKDNMAKYYHLLIMLRGFLLIFLTVFMDVQPLLQVFPLIFYNLWILYFLFGKRIFKDSKLQNINKIKETLIVAGEMVMLCLCFQSDSEDYYSVLGWMTVGCLGSAAMLELVYLVAIQVIELIHEIRRLKLLLFANKDPKKKKELERVNAVLELRHKVVRQREDLISEPSVESIDLHSQLANLSNDMILQSQLATLDNDITVIQKTYGF